MMNILIPMSGPNRFESNEYQYPKPLIEVDGKPVIQNVITFLDRLEGEKQYIFIVNKSDCDSYHLDDVLRLITDGRCRIVKIDNKTKGAACSALMAIEHINNEDSLIISNSDHVISHDINRAIKYFNDTSVDAGTICFESVHPKWSFVRLDDSGNIIEAAEKRPLSKYAIAGFYYFKSGSTFVESAMKMIEKGASVNDNFYIAPSLNELVLNNGFLKPYMISGSEYFNFYSPHKIKEYESWVERNCN